MAILSEVKKHYGELQLYINGEWVPSKAGKMEKILIPPQGR